MPTPDPDQVLVKLRATSRNLSDWECLLGSPMYGRIGGLRRPARNVLGSDIAPQSAAKCASTSTWMTISSGVRSSAGAESSPTTDDVMTSGIGDCSPSPLSMPG